MSNIFQNMGLTSSKLFQISLSDIIGKVHCYSACCGGQVLLKITAKLKSQTIKNIVEKSLTLLIKLCLRKIL